MKYQEACDRARDISRTNGCIQHVCAVLSHNHDRGETSVHSYRVDDWQDGTTVAVYSDGQLILMGVGG